MPPPSSASRPYSSDWPVPGGRPPPRLPVRRRGRDRPDGGGESAPLAPEGGAPPVGRVAAVSWVLLGSSQSSSKKSSGGTKVTLPRYTDRDLQDSRRVPPKLLPWHNPLSLTPDPICPVAPWPDATSFRRCSARADSGRCTRVATPAARVPWRSRCSAPGGTVHDCQTYPPSSVRSTVPLVPEAHATPSPTE